MEKLKKNAKRDLRESMKKLLREQKTALREKRSKFISSKLTSMEQFIRSSTVMVYVPLPSEVDTTGIISRAWEQGKTVAVPYIDEKDRTELKVSGLLSFDQLEDGPLGIQQPAKEFIRPIPDEEIELVLVPAIAFDKNNHRLGRGKGFYDRFLAEFCTNAFTAGLAFSFQLLDDLPKDPHDVAVDMVVTD